ncbi:MAG: hypothetical protein VX738_06650 [Planctomycetota bacterium]|nr:hypothetical protein [Planctomycetota bacterium]
MSEIMAVEAVVNILISDVSITRGYVRQDGLRDGRTINARIPNTEQWLKIRCQNQRNGELEVIDPQQLFRFRIQPTDYDDVRKVLIGFEVPHHADLPNPNHFSPSEPLAPPASTDSPTALAGLDDHALVEPDTTADDLDRMQSESLLILNAASEDLDRASESNVALVVDLPFPDADDDEVVMIAKPNPSDSTTTMEGAAITRVAPLEGRIPSALPVPELVIEKENNQESELKEPTSDAEDQDAEILDLSDPRLHRDAMSESQTSSKANALRQEILGESSEPIWLKQFSELISAETGVAIRTVRDVQQRMWNTIVSPDFFDDTKNTLSFFPFGNFRLRRNGDDLNLDFASHPCQEIAEFSANEDVRYEQIAEDVEMQNESPVAHQALRIATRVAPLVGLSPPVTYEVIFETLLLLLKVFGVGKRRVRFTDIGEFFPVLLRGTVQYHFRPYRPLIRLASESFRKVIDLAENEGEGHLQFVRDRGVPAQPLFKSGAAAVARRKKKTSPVGWIVLGIFVWFFALWVLEIIGNL